MYDLNSFYNEKTKRIVDERLKKNYNFGMTFNMMVWEKLREIWTQINPHIGYFDYGTFFTDQNGQVSGNYLFNSYLVSIGEVLMELFEFQDKQMQKTTEKIDKMEKYLKYAVPDFDNLIECPHCKQMNHPDKKFCVYCNTQISSIEGKLKLQKENNHE